MYDELIEQLQENICTYLDGYDESILDNLCQIVIDTFDKAFFAPAPITLDNTTQN